METLILVALWAVIALLARFGSGVHVTGHDRENARGSLWTAQSRRT